MVQFMLHEIHVVLDSSIPIQYLSLMNKRHQPMMYT